MISEEDTSAAGQRLVGSGTASQENVAAKSRAKTRVGKLVTVIAVTFPLGGVGFAIAQLWRHQVVPIDLVLVTVLYLLTGIGVTVGFHRFATHKSFKAPRVVEFVLLALGSMAVEGGVIQWSATHWKHHRLADKEGDPHSPLEGLLHAHMGWMFDSNPRADPKRDARHLLSDPVAAFVDRTQVGWIGVGLLIPFLIDGWRGLVWGGLVRIFLTHHITWSVNSICHQFGRRDFETPDASRNQWLVGVFGLGEGWHNNHHAFPESAFHGLRWYQVDVAGYVIRGLERTRLASGVRRVSASRMELRRQKLAVERSLAAPPDPAGAAGTMGSKSA